MRRKHGQTSRPFEKPAWQCYHAAAMSAFEYDSRHEREFRRIPRDLIRARELLRDLVWKDLRARYRYAVMGFLWAVLEPLAFTLILAFVFSVLLADKAGFAALKDGPPFTVMFLCGLIFWQYTSAALTSATFSLVISPNLIKKVHFTREVVPLAAIAVPLVNLAIGVLLLLTMHLLLGGSLSLALAWLPLVFSIQFALTAGLALLFSCGHVIYRDVGNMVNVALMFGFYASPVFYPLDKVLTTNLLPGWAVKLYLLNPMAELLHAYRQILFEQRFPDVSLLLWPAALAAVFVLAGAWLFRRHAPTFSDYL